jgi:hypothetical protein
MGPVVGQRMTNLPISSTAVDAAAALLAEVQADT